MIKIKRGFKIDIDASEGPYAVVTPGTLFDDNSKKVYAPGQHSFKKFPNSIKWVYYDVISEIFTQTDTEITLDSLDSDKQNLCPVCYMETNGDNIIVVLVALNYDEGFNIPAPSGGDVSAYKNIGFVTETNLPVNGYNVITTYPILQIFNLFIYEKGDVILGTISHDSNKITLQEDVSPALCEVTYGYIIR